MGISNEEFEKIVWKAGKKIKRIEFIKVDGLKVKGVYKSQTGNTEWDFVIDFDDEGKLTGKYSLNSENKDSNIPKRLADTISEEIESNLKKDAPPEPVVLPRSDSGFWDKTKRFLKNVATSLLIILTVCSLAFAGYQYLKYKSGIEVTVSNNELEGETYDKVVSQLEKAGFTNVNLDVVHDLEVGKKEDEGVVTEVTIGEDSVFSPNDKYPSGTRIEVRYHVLKELTLPVSSKDAVNMDSAELESLLKEKGFVDIKLQPQEDLITGWITKDGSVAAVSIGGDEKFIEGAEYRPDTEIIITYHTFSK